MKIRCLIVDDEPLAVELLQDYVGRLPFLHLEGKCYDAITALQFLHEHDVDLIFLDINLPQLDGMELAGLVNKETRFIFTTAYAEYAIQSYEKNAFDYLLKPITFERFLKSITRFREVFEIRQPDPDENKPSSNVLFVKSGKKIVQLELDKVSHIEGMKDYATFYTSGQKIIIARTLKELEKQLPEYLQRIHNSYFVNIRKIQKIEDNHVTLTDVKEPLPISNKFRESFLRVIQSGLL